MLSLCPFDISVGEGAFVIGLSQISSFFSFERKNRSTEGCSKLKKSKNKTISGDIGLNIRTLASPKVGQDQVSGGVSFPCWHATPVADAPWKPVFSEMSDSVIMLSPVIMSQSSIMSIRYRMSLVTTRRTNASPKRDRTRCPEEKASSVGMPHPLQMFYGNLSQLAKKSNSVIRSRSVIGSKIGVMPDQWRVSL